MATMVAVTMNNARAHPFASLSPERRVEDDLGRGMREAARQARGPRSILQRLSAFQAGQQSGRLGLTREEVFSTVASVLGTTAAVSREVMTVGIELLELAPIPGLASVGQALLNIWTTFEGVKENRHACERLAEDCAVIVSFLREEVFVQDGFSDDDMRGPLAQLDMALQEAEAFVKEQKEHTHAHDYVNHRANRRRVEHIQRRLTRAFEMFNHAIPMHTMMHVTRFLRREMAEHQSPQVAAPSIVTIQMPPPQSYQPPEVRHSPENILPAAPPTVLQIERPTVIEASRRHGSGRLEHHPHAPPQNNHAGLPVAQPPQTTSNKQLDIPRLYARLVQHEFDESLLTMSLWTPTPVHIGAVGYYSRADGGFVTLFNAHAPLDIAGIPAVSQYGSVEAYQPKPTSCAGRPHTFALQAGSPAAYLYTEKTMYRCFINLQGPENWLLENADKIIAFFRGQHPIDRKRLVLVTGTMAAQVHALCVCPNPPRSNGTVSLIYPSISGIGSFLLQIAFHRHKAKPGQPWGEWSQKPGANGAEPVVSKVSMVKAAHEPWDAVFLSVLSYHRLVDEVAQ
ncbi:hypothetical protein EWM64_g5888 [Hericium alpestre]|uniref:Uncharacterized protein n=1 Tax=Hericium alpestre TaxID=135208 RepID=A0A4Y9ZV61_9AGAM|nr:hypothetical protein EWM64_g5888 [Hericium alpestre]